MDFVFVSSVCALSSAFLLVIGGSSSWLRKKFPKKVKCWFCGCRSSVNYDDANSWICGSCEQYNGFDKDGGYNKDLPAQYNESLNNKKWMNKPGKWSGNGASLCHTCNYHQELKVSQLASFNPINQDNYDIEIEHFRVQLEKSYKLCKNCQSLLNDVLKKIGQPSNNTPRRLFQKAVGKVVKRWKLVWLSSLVAGALAIVLSGDFRKYYTFAPEAVTVIGGLVILAECWAHSSVWAWLHATLWATASSMPYWNLPILTQQITQIQFFLALCVLSSSSIIALRRLLYENRLLKRQAQRELKRTRDSMRVWSVPSFHKSPDSEMSSKRREEPSLGKSISKDTSLRSSVLKPPSARGGLIRPSAVRPSVKRSLNQEMSQLRLGCVDTSSYKSSGNPFSPTMWGNLSSRSSSQSSGISSLSPSRTSPTWYKDASHFSPLPSMRSTPITWQNHLNTNDMSWNNCYSRPYSEQYPEKCPTDQNAVYSTYPVTYYYSHVPKSGAELPAQNSYFSLVISSLPAIVLAASNAALVYFIYTKSN